MISNAIQYVLDGYRTYFVKAERPEPQVMVHVDEIASKIAKFYEQIRNVVDYREEHLLRKNNIFRALERRVVLSDKKDAIAESLIKEIIRSGHLANDAIPEEKVTEVERLIANLRYLVDAAKNSGQDQKRELSQWLIRAYASAIEECLDPPVRDRVLADAMFLALKDHLVIKGREIPETDRIIQLFIGIQRALLRVDDDQLAYRLLKFLNAHWDNPASQELRAFAAELPRLKNTLDAHATHTLGPVFFKLCNHYNTIFLLLGDAVFQGKNFIHDPQELFTDEKALALSIQEAYRTRYESQKKRLRRFAFFSIISLFITKVAVALAVEIPIDTFITHDYSLVNTVINIAFPPILMAFIIACIRLPSKNNIHTVIAETNAIAFSQCQKEYLLVIPEEKNRLIRKTVLIFYVAISVAVLYGVLRALMLINFSVASTAVFILFTSIVAATGVRVQNRSREISMEEKKPAFRSLFGDILFMPFVTLGKFTIAGLGKFKFLVIVVNLIDAPFQIFVSFIENFNTFIRSKKDELH